MSRRSRRILLAAMLLASSQVAHAQVIYSCANAKHQVAHRSQPCLRGERTVKVRNYQIPVETRAGRQRLQEAHDWQARQQEARSASAYQYGGSSGPRFDERRYQCDSAKQHRQRVLEQAGLHRNFDLLRLLDEQVRDACKGR